MDRLRANYSELRWLVAILVPLALWAMIWLGISAGPFRGVLSTDNPFLFINGLRSVFPIAAGSLAMLVIFAKLYWHHPKQIRLVGPLAFAVLYGLVGFVASARSPDGSTALFWAALYVSVPLVLWLIVWLPEPLEHLRRVINVTWLLVIGTSLGLFTVALLYLDLGSIILSPSTWLECPLNGAYHGKSWFTLTDAVLRPTGVGRFAAIGAVIALSGLWQRNWRFLWAAVLFVCLVLLLTSGARTAFVGFVAAALLVFLLHGGRKAIIAGVLAVPILVALIWIPGVHHTFIKDCFLKGGFIVTRVVAVGDPSAVQAQVPIGTLSQAEAPEPTASSGEAPSATLSPAETPSPVTEPDQGPTPVPALTEAPTISQVPAAAPTPALVPTTAATTSPVPAGTAAPAPDPTTAPTTSPVPAGTAAPAPDPTTAPTTSPAPAGTAAPAPDPTTAPTTSPAPAGTAAPAPDPTTAPRTSPAPAGTAVPAPDPTTAPAPVPVGTAALPAEPRGTSEASPMTGGSRGTATTLPTESPGSTLETVPSLISGLPKAASTPVALAGQPATSASQSSEDPALPLPRESVELTKVRSLGPFFKFTGRTDIWSKAYQLFKQSPVIGHGFQADRLILRGHTHNTYLHAMIQTGALGTIALVAALVYGWASLIRVLRNLDRLPLTHKHLAIQAGAILVLLSLRTFPESTGAFFGVDWLLLAPILIYLHAVTYTYLKADPQT